MADIATNTARYWIESRHDPRWTATGVCPLYGDETPKEIDHHLQFLSEILGDLPDDIVIGWEPQ
jgi:hypothetical protein